MKKTTFNHSKLNNILRKKECNHIFLVGSISDFTLCLNAIDRTAFFITFGKRYVKLYNLEKKFLKRIKTLSINKEFFKIYSHKHSLTFSNIPDSIVNEYKVYVR